VFASVAIVFAAVQVSSAKLEENYSVYNHEDAQAIFTAPAQGCYRREGDGN